MTAQSHGKAFVKATWDYRVCLLKPLQTACCVAFCSKCASVACSEIHQPWIFPKHVTANLHMTLKPQSTEPEAWPWRLGVCRVITPFPSCSKASPLLSLCSPMSLGKDSGKDEQVWLEHRAPFQGEGHGAKRSEWFRPCPHFYCMLRFTALPNAKQILESRTPQHLRGRSAVYKAGWCFRRETRPEWAPGSSLNLAPLAKYSCYKRLFDLMLS